MKILTTDAARRVKDFLEMNKSYLHRDAAKLGMSLTDEQIDFIVKKLKHLVRAGREKSKVAEALREKTIQLIKTI